MQNESLWEDKMSNAEIEQLKEKTRFYKNAGDLLAIFSTAIVIIAILIIILLIIITTSVYKKDHISRNAD